VRRDLVATAAELIVVVDEAAGVVQLAGKLAGQS